MKSYKITKTNYCRNMENKTSTEKIIFVTVIMLLVILVFPLVEGLQFDFDFTNELNDRFDLNQRFNRDFNNIFSFEFNDDFSPNHKIYFNNDSNNAFNFDDDFDYRLYFDNNFSQRFDFDDEFNLDEKFNPDKELQFSILKYGIYSNIRERQTMSIKTQEQWTDLWRQMFPGQETPSYVDFEQSMLISVFMGEQPSGGYDISVTKIIETRDALKVYVEEVSPGVNCIVTLALTHPYQIVKLDYFNKPTIFEFNNKVKSC